MSRMRDAERSRDPLPERSAPAQRRKVVLQTRIVDAGMSGPTAIPARVLISEAVCRFGAEKTARRLEGLPAAGELLTLAVEHKRATAARAQLNALEP